MRIIEGPAQFLLDRIVSFPRTVLFIFLAATAVLGWQARHFAIDASADTLLTKDNRDYIQTLLVNRRFSPQEFLLVVYRPRTDAVFSPQTFSDLQALGRKLDAMDRVQSTRSILNVPLLSLAGADLSTLTDPSQWTEEKKHFEIGQLQQAFRDHPIYQDLLINKAQTATAIQVLFKEDKRLDDINSRILDIEQKTLQGPLSDPDKRALTDLRAQAAPIEQDLNDKRQAEIERIRQMAAGYRDHADIYLGGVHVVGYQLIRIIKHDLAVFGAAIGVIICLILYVLFRRLRWVIIPVVSCACSVLSTTGLFALFGFKATVISANFMVLQIILTLSLVMYLIVQYREYDAQLPRSGQIDLVKRTLTRKARPIFYAGVTTAVGFGSLLISSIEPVIAFGRMMIIATLFSIGVSLILFPAMMAMFGRERAVARRSLVRRVLKCLAAASVRHPAAVGGVGLAVLAASAAGMLRLDVENSFINYFKDSTRVHQELTFIDRQFGGSTPLDIVYTVAPSERKKDLVLTADAVQTLQRIQASLASHRGVGKILSVVNFTELAKQLNQNKPVTEYELTAAYWTMGKSLRTALLGSFFSPQHEQVRFSVRIQDSTPGLNRARLLADIRNDMQRTGVREDRYLLSNLFVLYQDILQRLFRSQILTMGIVYAGLSFTLLVLFRSFKIALIGVVPNMLAVAVVLGAMGWLRIPLDLMTITIASVAMGIAINDSIQYTHRYLEELREGSPRQAVERSHMSVAFAIVYTTVIVVVGFSLLAFSDFKPSMLFGLLTGLALAIGLIFNLTLLPVMLKRFVGVAPPLRRVDAD